MSERTQYIQMGEFSAVVPQQAGGDLCPTPGVAEEKLVCTMASVDPVLSPNSGFLTVESRILMNGNALCMDLLPKAAAAGQSFNSGTCEAQVSSIVNGADWSPAKTVLNVHDGIVEIGGMNGGVPMADFLSTLSTRAVQDSAIVAAQKPTNSDNFGTIGTGVVVVAAFLAWGIGRIKSRFGGHKTRYIEHPESHLEPNSRVGTYESRHTFKHTKKAADEEWEAKAQNPPRTSYPLDTALEESGIERRPSDYQTWPHSRIHSLDREAYDELARISSEVPRTEMDSFVFFLEKTQEAGRNDIYRRKSEYKRAVGDDNPVTINNRLNQRHFFQGSGDIRSLFETFKSRKKKGI